MRAALQRIAPRAQHEDDQHLGGEQLDEPAGLEQCFVCMEDQQQQAEGQKVETELTGPITSMKLRIKRMSQCSGFSVISLSTSSSGIGISETA